jgi:hypothetical protein
VDDVLAAAADVRRLAVGRPRRAVERGLPGPRVEADEARALMCRQIEQVGGLEARCAGARAEQPPAVGEAPIGPWKPVAACETGISVPAGSTRQPAGVTGAAARAGAAASAASAKPAATERRSM